MSEQCCALCGDSCNTLVTFEVTGGVPAQILICQAFQQQLTGNAEIVSQQWRCLSDAIWSPEAAVQVVAYRMLYRLAEMGEGWAQDLLATAYLEDDVRAWAESGLNTQEEETGDQPKDSNGMLLTEGDSVTLIKDLEVKGAGFTAKRGTLVKNIHLTNNPKHIEGKVNGTTIVLVTAYLKKA